MVTSGQVRFVDFPPSVAVAIRAVRREVCQPPCTQTGMEAGGELSFGSARGRHTHGTEMGPELGSGADGQLLWVFLPVSRMDGRRIWVQSKRS